MTSDEEVAVSINQETDAFQRANLIDQWRKQSGKPLLLLSKKLGMKPAYVCHLLRLRKLPDALVDGYYAKVISLSHLFVISRLKTADAMMAAYEEVLKNNLTVIQTEYLVRESLYGWRGEGDYLPDDAIKVLKSRLQDVWPNAEVKLKQSRIKSSLSVIVKDSLKATNPVIRSLLRQLESWVTEEKKKRP